MEKGTIHLSTANAVGAVLNKKMGVTTGFAPSVWADTINLMGKLPEKTVSGSIAHFEDGADDVPLKACSVTVDPVVIPKSKNLAIFSTDILTQDRTTNGVTFHATSENTVNISGTATGGSAFMTVGYNVGDSRYRFLPSGTYTLHCNLPDNGNATVASVVGYYVGTTERVTYVTNVHWQDYRSFTLTDDAYINIQITINSGYSVNQEVWVQLEAGTTGTEYEPKYDAHIRSVSSIDMYSGTNLLDGEFKVGWINNDGSIGVNENRLVSANYNSCEGGKSYYINSSYNQFRAQWYDANKNIISMTGTLSCPRSLSAPSNARFVRVAFATESVDFANLNYPSTVTSEQDDAVKTTIQLGREIYGGSLNLLTGVLTSSWAKYSGSNFDWRKHADGYFYVTSAYTNKVAGATNIIGVDLVTVSSTSLLTTTDYCICGRASDGAIYIRLTGTETLEEFQAWIAQRDIAFEITTPVTYQLTPMEINSVLGVNNIWCNTGSISVTYRRDIDLALSSSTPLMMSRPPVTDEENIVEDEPVIDEEPQMEGDEE